jgi:ATP-dependent Lon protease
MRMSATDSPMSLQVPIESTTTKKSLHQQLHLNEHNKKLSKINTCKGLQRKLEQKVERARKNFLQNEKLNQLENDIVSFDQGH